MSVELGEVIGDAEQLHSPILEIQLAVRHSALGQVLDVLSDPAIDGFFHQSEHESWKPKTAPQWRKGGGCQLRDFYP